MSIKGTDISELRFVKKGDSIYIVYNKIGLVKEGAIREELQQGQFCSLKGVIDGQAKMSSGKRDNDVSLVVPIIRDEDGSFASYKYSSTIRHLILNGKPLVKNGVKL